MQSERKWGERKFMREFLVEKNWENRGVMYVRLPDSKETVVYNFRVSAFQSFRLNFGARNILKRPSRETLLETLKISTQL